MNFPTPQLSENMNAALNRLYLQYRNTHDKECIAQMFPRAQELANLIIKKNSFGDSLREREVREEAYGSTGLALMLSVKECEEKDPHGWQCADFSGYFQNKAAFIISGLRNKISNEVDSDRRMRYLGSKHTAYKKCGEKDQIINNVTLLEVKTSLLKLLKAWAKRKPEDIQIILQKADGKDFSKIGKSFKVPITKQAVGCRWRRLKEKINQITSSYIVDNMRLENKGDDLFGDVVVEAARMALS